MAMRFPRRVPVGVAILLAIILSLNPLLALAEGQMEEGAATDRYIVVFHDAVVPGPAAADLAQRHGIEVSHVYSYALKGFAGRVPAGRLTALQHDPRVKLVEADRPAYPTGQTVPTGVKRVKADQNLIANINGSDERVGVDIAIIDTGIDPSHPDLNVVRRTNCARGGPFNTGCKDGEGSDGYGHGTHVAGTAAALDNSIGVAGMAPGARLWSVKVFDDSGRGYVSWVIAGVDWVTKNASEIEVANMSLGWGGVVTSARLAIQSSVAKGVVYVVAAGNESKDVYGADGQMGTSDDAEPASYPEVATIAALSDTDGQPGGSGPASSWKDSDRNMDGVDDGADDSFAWFSNFSRSVVAGNPVTSAGKAIDLIMPGVDITSTVPGGYGRMSGTSMASPHAAGLAALYIAANGRATSAGGVYAIRQALIDGGVAQTDTNGLYRQNDPDGNKENLGWAGPLGPVDNPPTATIASPADGATVSGTVTIGVSATDNEDAAGSLLVEVNIGSTAWQAAAYNTASGAYELSWATAAVADGSYSIDARATDSAGSTTSAGRVTVTVDNVDDVPVVAITSPGQGAVVSGSVTVVASASDDRGVAQVEFFVDGASLGVDDDGSNGWSFAWSTTDVSDGSHTLTALATDTAGNSASHSIAVTVANTGAITTHIGDLDGSASILNPATWKATVTITVHDSNDGPVSGATVSGDWSNGATGSASCTTDSSGQCSVATGGLNSKKVTGVTFTVNGVTYGALTYDSNDNHDPDGDSNGTSITISK